MKSSRRLAPLRKLDWPLYLLLAAMYATTLVVGFDLWRSGVEQHATHAIRRQVTASNQSGRIDVSSQGHLVRQMMAAREQDDFHRDVGLVVMIAAALLLIILAIALIRRNQAGRQPTQDDANVASPKPA